MTSPRTPRQDAEALRAEIRDVLGEAPTCEHGTEAGTYCWPCAQLDRGAELAAYAAPLSEVLPETPEQSTKIFAPWSSETALTLIDFQQIGHLHPFTCPRDHRGQYALVANNGGWFCPADDCDYTQNWAWAYMTDRSAWPESPIQSHPASQSVPAVPVSPTGGKETGEAAGTATEALNAAGVGSLSEAIGLALNDTYAGLEFEDPTFESGTMAIMAVLRERLADWQPPLPDLDDLGSGRGVWLSPDGIHLAVEADDGELEELESDPEGGWLPKGMLDMVPDEWVRLVPVPAGESEVTS